MTTKTVKTALGDNWYRYTKSYYSAPVIEDSEKFDTIKNDLVLSVLSNPGLTSVNGRSYREASISYDGTSWVFKFSVDVEEVP